MCGVAYLNAFYYPSWAYGYVAHPCYQETAGHEVAHMFGAAHDRRNSGSFTPVDRNAYGYWIPNTPYCTIMA